MQLEKIHMEVTAGQNCCREDDIYYPPATAHRPMPGDGAAGDGPAPATAAAPQPRPAPLLPSSALPRPVHEHRRYVFAPNLLLIACNDWLLTLVL